MKFQNLTITLTLIFLSTFAICVIGLIPMEQILVNTANGYDYEHNRHYDNPETGAYRGWTLTIVVSASSCGAYASVTPKIINPNRFESNEDTKDWIGQAFVYVQRDAYTKVVRTRSSYSNTFAIFECFS